MLDSYTNIVNMWSETKLPIDIWWRTGPITTCPSISFNLILWWSCKVPAAGCNGSWNALHIFHIHIHMHMYICMHSKLIWVVSPGFSFPSSDMQVIAVYVSFDKLESYHAWQVWNSLLVHPYYRAHMFAAWQAWCYLCVLTCFAIGCFPNYSQKY